MRPHIVFLGFVIAASVIGGRLFSLQVKDYGLFAAFARGQQQVFATINQERGKIMGRELSGNVVSLAVNRDWQMLYAVPKDIQDPQKTAHVLAVILGMPEQDLYERLRQPDDPYEPIKHQLSDEEVSKISQLAVPGLKFQSERLRFYPFGKELSHVLGFLAQNDQDQNRVGRYGIEAQYEELLQGHSGTLTGERDGRGQVLKALSKIIETPQDGATVVLTIDPNIQHVAERVLADTVEKFGADGGTVIVADPKTMKIFAMANWPTFDPNRFFEAKDHAYFDNPAVSALFEPGSVFKAITMASAIDSGAVSPSTQYDNTGSRTISSYTISNTLQEYNGSRTMIETLEYSLNTGAIFAMEKTGPAQFSKYVHSFGFGNPSGIELPGEVGGNLQNLSEGRPINYATASFGQGIAVTPISLLRSFAALANGGLLLEPRIVERIEYSDGTEAMPEHVEPIRVISQRSSRLLSAMLVQVVENGTGTPAKIAGYSIGGKTGTAQVPNPHASGYSDKDIHTFTGYFPAFDPRFVILVKIDDPKGVRYAEGSAVPAFREIAEYLITYAAVPPDNPTK